MSDTHCSTAQMPCILIEARRGQGPVSGGSRYGRTKHVSRHATAPFDRPWAFEMGKSCNVAALRQGSPHHQETMTNSPGGVLPTSRSWKREESRSFSAG